SDLQVTGIGRTVSDLRKIDGEVGLAAKTLVAKWKSVVAAATISSSESNSGDDKDNDEPSPSHKSNNRDENIKKTVDSSRDSQQNKREVSHSNGKEQHHRKHKSGGSSSSDNKHGSHASRSDKHHSKERTTKHTTATHSALVPERNESMDCDDDENRLIIDMKSEQGKDNRDDKHRKNDRKDDKRSNEHRSDKHKSSRNSVKSTQKSSEKSDSHKSSSDKTNEKSSSHHHHHHRKRDNQTSEDTSVKRKHHSDDSSTSKVSSSKSKKPKTESSNVDEIDSSMGTSFAEALGMMMPKKSSKASKPKSDTIKLSSNDQSKVTDKAKMKVSPSSSSSSSSSSRNETKVKETSTHPPKLLLATTTLPPLEPVIAVDFPTISNNYKPMPLNPTVMECVFNNYNQPQPKKIMTDEEAFGSGISSKSIRILHYISLYLYSTKVYSGVKSGTVAQIPSLYQMCIRVLQKNIDGLEQTGSIPFDILKPVLQLASPEQLFTIESYNPYLMEDTDKLWEFHCKRKFRNLKREELETWREMFLRCTEEREARFNSLTNTIKKSQTVAVPVKQTKLAYVNSAVKPPRGVIKKQNQFGTKSKLVATPAARVAALNNLSNNMAKPGDVRLRVAATLRDTAQVTSHPTKTKTAAPLMQKSLQYFRSRFKR
ncbi:Transcription elongation factor B polypeptide 3, partial [Pseudolycoriella hygida]